MFQYKYADYIFYNGTVISVNENDDIASAVAIVQNKIIYVGIDDFALSLKGENTKIYDLKGRTLMPGINDTHFHPILNGLLGNEKDAGMINTSKKYVSTLSAMLELLKTALKDKKPGEWVSMMGYEPLLFEDDKRHPSISELDSIAPHNPVHCMHGGGHICMYNSKALEYLGIYSVDDAGKFPDGEVEVKDGKLTGMLYGHTHFKLWGMVEYDERVQERAAMKSHKQLLEAGITSIGDMGECDKPSYHIMQKLSAQGKFKVRSNMAIHSIFGKEYSLKYNDYWMNMGFMSGLGNEKFRVGPCKFMIDGGSGGPSCATKEPYSHDPSLKRERGWEREEVAEYIAKIHAAECQATAHAIGDLAVEFMVEGYEKIFEKDPEGVRNARHRIEHCTLVNQDLVDRMAKMNICPSVNAGLVQMLGDNYMKFYGERNKYLGALRSMIDAGVMCSLHSDAPSGPMGLNTIDGCVNRYDRSKNVQCDSTQAVTVMEAIRVATINGAYSTFEEDIKGSIGPNKLADLIVLSDDILKIDKMDIVDLKVDLTMIDGIVEYERI